MRALIFVALLLVSGAAGAQPTPFGTSSGITGVAGNAVEMITTGINSVAYPADSGTVFHAILSGVTTAIGGSPLSAACASTTVTITGAVTGNVVEVTPTTYPGDALRWFGYVSTTNTITVKVCADVSGTPSSSVYNVRVIQ